VAEESSVSDWNAWSGDGDVTTDPWDTITFNMGDEGVSQVIDLVFSCLRRITLTANEYDDGSGSPGKIYIRGSESEFYHADASPSWEEYTESIERTWRFIQVRVTKG